MFEKIMKEIENNLKVTRAMIDECEVLGNEDDAMKLAASTLAEENNYIPESLKVIRKLKPSFGEES